MRVIDGSQASDHMSTNDIYSVGMTVYVALLGVVTLEVALISQYITWLFIIFLLLCALR